MATYYWVEYNFIETPHGIRPEWIKEFKTKQEAEKWAKENTTDGTIVKLESIKLERID